MERDSVTSASRAYWQVAGPNAYSNTWGLIPWFHTKGVKEWKFLTTNARVETLATAKTFKSALEKWRCLVPVSTFYE